MTNSVTIQGTEAINVSNIPNNAKKFVPEEDGLYGLSLTSDVLCHHAIKSWALNQALIFNTAPLVNNQNEKWYHAIETTQGVVIHALKDYPVYALLLDQVDSRDNGGSATITFTKIPAT